MGGWGFGARLCSGLVMLSPESGMALERQTGRFWDACAWREWLLGGQSNRSGVRR